MSEAIAGLIEDVFKPLVEAGKQFVRGKLLDLTHIREFAADIVYNFIAKMEDVGVDPGDITLSKPEEAKLKDFIAESFRATALMTAIVSEDAAEVITESISEAFSNAVYSGFGGLVDTFIRMRVGGMPPQDFVDFDDALHPYTKALLDAMTGYNFHVVMLRRIINELKSLYNDLLQDDLFRDYIATYRWSYYPKAMMALSYGKMMEAMAMRLLESIAATFEALFARAEDAVNEYRAAKWLYEHGVITEDKYDKTVAKVYAELIAIDQEIDEILNDLTTALQEWQIDVPPSIQVLKDMVEGTINDNEQQILGQVSDFFYTLRHIRDKGRPWFIGYTYVIMINEQVFKIGEVPEED